MDTCHALFRNNSKSFPGGITKIADNRFEKKFIFKIILMAKDEMSKKNRKEELNSRATFPTNFLWGAATSSYQIEGAALEDGKGRSIWDVFCEKPHAIAQKANGITACDHYHRYQEDVNIMAEMGLQAYRFSFSWPRVLPKGMGESNEKGLDFYDKLIDALLEKNIQPWATLYHWDMPFEIYAKGGWLNRDISDWFAEYAQLLARKFGDRVKNWATFNEPQVFILLAHKHCIHAPGHEYSNRELLRSHHHVLLAHGKAVKVLRENVTESFIGFVNATQPVGVVTNSSEDLNAAHQFFFSEKNPALFNAAWYNDPIVFGKYPEDSQGKFTDCMESIQSGDMEIISSPIDFIGCNTYDTPTLVKTDNMGETVKVMKKPGEARTAINWGINSKSLYWASYHMYKRYKLPIYITENGISNLDWVHDDGKVHDPQRIDYLKTHLRYLNQAIHDGIDIRGYFQWSLMDNFEWARGYEERFGLIHVDFETLKRTPKDSYYWYSELIKRNQVPE